MTKKRKITALVAAFLLVLSGGVFLLGFFPVAVVGNDYVLYRNFAKRSGALERFEKMNRQVEGKPSSSEEETRAIRRMTLENMIGGVIAERYVEGTDSVKSYKSEAESLVEETLKTADANLLPKATEQLYGFTIEEFKEEVLRPQAFLEVLRRKLQEKNLNVDEVMSQELKNAKVRTYFLPFKWEDGKLVDK